MISCSLPFEEQKLLIQTQILKYIQQKDRELNKMKLENDQLAFELKCLETSAARN